ncbi:S-adenosyl-L-methionine-dependent methyltransferase [Periconia macrospinosa]|uniref:S-adenosyl-L-methionine-dependent methyltransferase n=1 Tax=Periconia macrospinosa TaxID=97972 RepID=A0A2V1D541_9PLEO|nr:S-adenosyl-L-methionine-dependent methyltransferase [Periconia macrospinosa]
MENNVVHEHGSHAAIITDLASLILRECSAIQSVCEEHKIPPPSMLAGTSTAFWSDDAPKLISSRSKALGLLEKLVTLLQGPHDFLHEFVAPNWDHGALYAFLQSSALEHMASSDGSASLFNLSNASGIPEDKLKRILALLRCRNIVDEPEEGIFTLTAVSEELVRDEDFRAWVEFQLFETRVASAHLAQALANKPNDYENGSSGFAQAWGSEMYDWHSKHPDKGDRFRRAMRGVSKSLDPADSLLRKHIPSGEIPSGCTEIVEIGGRYGFASVSLVEERPNLLFEVRCDSQDFIRREAALVTPSSKERITFTGVPSLKDLSFNNDSTKVFAYVIRNVFWNWTDHNAVKLLQALLPTLRAVPSTRILVTDGVSPVPTQFPQHIEIAYRRRDITTMTMHNVKQRTQAEWLKLFSQVHPGLKVSLDFLRRQ